ncbi:hypothetical protein D3C79_747650 [compost metagenome]
MNVEAPRKLMPPRLSPLKYSPVDEAWVRRLPRSSMQGSKKGAPAVGSAPLVRNALATGWLPGIRAKLGCSALAWNCMAACSTSVPSSGR